MSGKHAGPVSKVIGCAVVTACAAALPAHAGAADGAPQGQPSRQQNIGVFSGLAIGALAAGPVGALVGAGAGGWLGERYHRQKESAAALAQDLDHSEAERLRLAHSLTSLDGSLAQAQAQGAQLDQTVLRLDHSLQQTDQLGLDVGFRTADDNIEPRNLAPILKLGALAASMPDSVVRVIGCADPRGSPQYNEALSLRRAQNVAEALSGAGVPEARIVVEACAGGASSAVQGDLDGYAFERRVSVRIELPSPRVVAR